MMSDLTDAARLDMAKRAEAALEFLKPAFDVVHADYMARLVTISSEQPWETGKISKLATAARVVEEVRAQIMAIAADGKAAEADLMRARRIERMHPERRKILGIGMPA